jgi:hypothetical protein
MGSIFFFFFFFFFFYILYFVDYYCLWIKLGINLSYEEFEKNKERKINLFLNNYSFLKKKNINSFLVPFLFDFNNEKEKPNCLYEGINTIKILLKIGRL